MGLGFGWVISDEVLSALIKADASLSAGESLDGQKHRARTGGGSERCGEGGLASGDGDGAPWTRRPLRCLRYGTYSTKLAGI